MLKKEDQFILMDIAAFGDWLSKQSIRREITRVQNHHTWKPDYSSFNGKNHFRLLNGMKSSHLKRSFSDIAQNITTFPDGTVAVCRSFEKAPAGIYGANKGALCVEHVGNFDHGGDQLNDQHEKTILWLNAILCDKFDLYPDSNALIYHHWYDLKTGKRMNGEGVTKTCPGTNFFGGNKVNHAEACFIPKVIDYLRRIEEGFEANEKYELPLQEDEKNEVIEVPKRSRQVKAKHSSPPVSKLTYVEIQVRKLNVRTGPGVKYSMRRYLLEGERVPVKDEKGGWIQIADMEWVFGKYTKRLSV